MVTKLGDSLPKPDYLRQGHSKPQPTIGLPAQSRVKRMPTLPKRADDKPWPPVVRQWWRALWQSSMASKFLPMDVYGLYDLAELRAQFAETGNRALQTSIVRQEARFGLAPIDRRRLLWEVPDPDDAPPPKANRSAQYDIQGHSENGKPASDPRALLEAGS